MAQRTCSIDDCDDRLLARSWCRKHYMRWKRHGDPLATSRIVGDDAARFWSHVDKNGDGGCWNWTGSLDTRGYGSTRIGARMVRAHRHAYETSIGPIPDGLDLDHLCRNRPCVNPEHLEPVPRRVNTLRGISPHANNARKTHCTNGHEFTPENIRLTPSGHRSCWECRRTWERKRRTRSA